MGLVDFVANAGAALFGGKDESDQERSAKLENPDKIYPGQVLRIPEA